MNTVIRMQTDLHQALQDATGTAKTPTARLRQQAFEQRISAVERIATLFVAAGNEALHSRMFCALVLSCDDELPIKTLLGAVPHKGFRARPEGIIAAMANLGFYASQKSFDVARWSVLKKPALFWNDDQMFLLIASPSGDGGLIYDGKSSIRPFDLSDRSMNGLNVWKFGYDSALNPFSDVSRGHTGYSWARAMLSHFPHLGWTTTLASVMLALTGIMLPVAISLFFGQVIRLSSFSSLPYLVVGLVLIVLFETLFIIQRSNIVAWVASRLEYLVNTSSFARILKISPFLSERAAPTNQAARLRSFESIRDFVSGPTFASLLDIPVSMLSLVAVALLSLSELLIVAGSISLFLIVFAISWYKTSTLTSIVADEATEMQRLAIETLDKLELIRNAGMQDVWSERLSRACDREQNAQMRLRFTGLITETVSSIIYTVAVIGLMAEGASLVWAGEISGATLLALTILGLRIFMPFHTLCLSVQRFEQVRRSLRQINQLMDLPLESRKGRDRNNIEPLTGRLSLVNVGFKAADTRPVFVGLDLEVEPGEIIGIYGANGTGKTTVFKMLLGMVDIALGTVRIDGVDLRQLPLHELRRRVSYVPQRPRIFPGTLRQNLAYANPLASAAQIAGVIETVGLTEQVRALPNGLDYQITGSDEERLSTSFRYRFAFARALMINSKLILIDEIPNSLLDGEVGEFIQGLFRKFRGKRTILFVSHRSDFLREANRVIALRYGKVPIVTQPSLLMERAL
ncbi:peptidase domain-containing ABC transporter [Rhizobium halophytocola]|uniref:ABC-type bacteriocin/lantibiotic exporter with double-glycine peptidase domain n=1 Tax=Rhizobium halophytocola TaxID=735519 RepID=A0ABS4DVJ4_9HYPH|nr:ATP-binding cassette domain-containing protein [Rhizobium halophytocola]MBP1849719.1 ABC-type bacteriocin/lantibiotic exporter with double-glycine peptidase domain [Rhizobium halophytocola]